MFFRGKMRADNGFCQAWVFFGTYPQPTEDSQHMRIDDNARHFMAGRGNKIRSFSPDTRQFKQLVKARRKLAIKARFDHLRCFNDMSRFDMEKSDRVNDALNFGYFGMRQAMGIRITVEQLVSDRIYLLIGCLCAQNDCNQQLEATSIMKKRMCIGPDWHEPPVHFVEQCRD